jgi:hypothetical protein
MAIEKQISLKGRSLMIGVPAYDSKIDINSALNLIQVAGMAGQHGITMQVAHISGCSILPKARNTLIARFIESKCTDFLFLDTDVTFKPEYIFRLMGIATTKDIVGGVYPKKNKDNELAVDLLYSSPTASPIIEPEYGLYEAQHLPTGFMLIRRHVIEKMMEAYPELMYAETSEQLVCYALFDFQLKNQSYYGEDYIFCQRARALGIQIFVDPLLELGHKMIIEPKRELMVDLYNQQISRNINYVLQQYKFAKE